MPVYKFSALLNDSRQFRHHLLKVAGISLFAAVILGYFFDQRLSQYFADHVVASVLWAPSRIITDIGLSEYYFIISIGTWALCAFVFPRLGYFKKYAAKVDFFRRWGLNFLVALLVSGAITHVIKFCVGRQRPHKTPDFDPGVFHHFTTHWHWHSFSSGHSQVMFTVATMFSIAFPKFRWLWIPIAVIACITRVIVHDHFLSDIIFGGCVGYVGALLAMKWMKKSKNALY
ncbi:phosphatase PAP2 family protein [Bdellovibrio sp. HCB209]|uniref:phosphatase PAP2 family protein n=1 Tax=Bdellovibrio sp. HCB209 TaxID=3394354 RepID=UPI0039B47BC1